jgi:hypothetical protein
MEAFTGQCFLPEKGICRGRLTGHTACGEIPYLCWVGRSGEVEGKTMKQILWSGVVWGTLGWPRATSDSLWRYGEPLNFAWMIVAIIKADQPLSRRELMGQFGLIRDNWLAGKVGQACGMFHHVPRITYAAGRNHSLRGISQTPHWTPDRAAHFEGLGFHNLGGSYSIE